ncbi:uncharacterized protein TRUGW13939_04394 [Talaromyces rugulosus]|uniref:ABC transporter domain-containing protein n=1 Tax=Talaromyces rugulosus TaxID=121627 RepID=A0A7H8QWV3_TALRU|nr:uncharacterized protein TRUGW13939_04394 [Talaromyces rugulosus]QKX57283.1 hypothetical protein TRUGW13939_04394 [Talaromyces rugulosus]
MSSLKIGDWPSRAVEVIQSQLPLISALYYFVASSIRVALVKGSQQNTLSSSLQNGIICLMAIVLVGYGADAVLLLYATFSQEQHLLEDRLVFALWSLLLWTTLLCGLTSSGHARSLGFPHWGCWVLYTAGEGVLLFCHWASRPRLNSGYLALQLLRIVTLVILCGLAALQSCLAKIIWNNRCCRGEAARPLLQRLHARYNNGYSTITNDSGSNSTNESDDTHAPKEVHCSPGAAETLRGIIPFVWPTGKIRLQVFYVGVGLCLLTSRLFNVLIPMQLGEITDILKTGHVFPWKNIVYYASLRLLNSYGGVGALQTCMWLPLENESYEKVATTAFNKVMDLSCDFHVSKESGKVYDTVFRATGVHHVIQSLLFQIFPMVTDLCLAITILHVMFGPYMGLITASITVLFVWSSGKNLSAQREIRQEYIAARQKDVNILFESTTNWQTATYFNKIPYEKDRYSCAVNHHVKVDTTYKSSFQVMRMMQSFVLALGLLGACFLVAYQISVGKKEVGSFVMSIGYWSQLSNPLQFFVNGFSSVTINLVDVENFIALLNTKPSIKEKPDARQLTVQYGVLRFDDVRFSYNSQQKVLKGVSFETRPGQTLALVGATGSGKTTILKLLFRLYDASQGTIEIDGQNIRDVTLQSLRGNIGVVPQDPALFNDTILNNIRYAKLSATDEEIHDACRAVNLHDQFTALPNGYQTMVGERGVILSGGELQRVAIARVIVQNPQIILLDEATSSVDTVTEAHIQKSLSRVAVGRTMVIVAHRLSTVAKADCILALKDGKIIEQGAHQELVNAGGYYSQLWKQQLLDEHANVAKGTDKSLLKPEAPEFIPQQAAE